MKRIEIQRRQIQELASEGEQKLNLLWAEIRRDVLEMLDLQHQCLSQQLRPALAQRGVHLMDWCELSCEQVEEVRQYFQSHVLPVVTPLAYDPAHPFPFLSNLSTSLGVMLRAPRSDQQVFARVKVPNTLPQWIELKQGRSDDRRIFVPLHEAIRHHLDQLFPGMEIISTTLIRITRDAEVESGDEDRENFRAQVEDGLRRRRFEPVVRIEFSQHPDLSVRKLLIEKLEVSEADVYELPGVVDYTGLFGIASLSIPGLRDTPWNPLVPPVLREHQNNLFELIRAGDVLVHHPYDSFDATVEQFIRQAADDPDVLAIKMTVYRVGDDTPFVQSLISAAESGKQVACVIEITARFDEARNLHWSQQLESAGAHVVYGVMGLKTHSKIALVVRQEADGLRSYAHIGTGNYHVKTARLYTDLGLFTCDPDLTGEVSHLFHYLTGLSRKDDFRKLLVAPTTMRRRFLELIQNEVELARSGQPAKIIAKMNQLEDPEMCEALCAASQAGVSVDLMIRGFSCLRPGVPGITDRIRIISIIGRFLEHSRVYYFGAGQSDPIDGTFYIGSADWMTRNLSGRVEAATPVTPRHLRQQLWEFLSILREDERQAWEMLPSGHYKQLKPLVGAHGAALDGTHVTLMNLTRSRDVGQQNHVPMT